MQPCNYGQDNFVGDSKEPCVHTLHLDALFECISKGGCCLCI